MFKDTDYDFGTVARGAKAEHRFVFENIYLEDVHIANVYASCSCTSVRIENPTVKTYEQGAIVAHFNTDSFLGQRGATITVVIDKPFRPKCNCRTAALSAATWWSSPAACRWARSTRAPAADQNVAVNYAGRDDWQIVGVKSSNPHVTAQVVETGRNTAKCPTP